YYRKITHFYGETRFPTTSKVVPLLKLNNYCCDVISHFCENFSENSENIAYLGFLTTSLAETCSATKNKDVQLLKIWVMSHLFPEQSRRDCHGAPDLAAVAAVNNRHIRALAHKCVCPASSTKPPKRFQRNSILNLLRKKWTS